MKKFKDWIIRCLTILAAIASVAAHAYVSLPNGDWREEETEDLRVKVVGGYVRVQRDYVFDKWQVNARWNTLAFEKDALDGSLKRVIRNEANFERQGDAFAFGKRAVIRPQNVQRIPGGSAQGTAPVDLGSRPTDSAGGGLALQTIPGYRWSNREGLWSDYDAEGKLVAYGDRNDVRVWLEYGAAGTPNAGRLIGVRDHFGRSVLTYSYTSDGRIAAVTDATDSSPSPRKVQYTWNGDLLTQVTDVRGYQTTYTYENNKLKTATDAEGRVQALTWGPTGRIYKVTAPDGGVVTYQYDYDKLKRVFYVRTDGPALVAGSPVEEHWFDADGREIRFDLNGVTYKKLLYDSANRLQTITDSLGRVTQVTADEFDNPVKVIQPDNSQVLARYSPVHGQLLEEADEAGIKTRYDYDAKGNLTSTTEAVGLPEQRTTDFTLDAWGQVTKQIRRGTTISLPDGNTVPVEDATLEYRYDLRGNLTRLIDAEGNARDYQVDSAGNLRRITDPLGKVWQFDFDPAGSITRSQDPLGRAGSQAYDKVGNRIRLTDAAGKTQQYVYDSVDRRIKTLDAYGKAATFDYDKNGRTLGGSDEEGRPLGTTEYNLDGFPVKTTDPKGNVTQVFYQDANGQAAPPGIAVRVIYPTYEAQKRLDARNRVTLDTKIQGAEGLVWGYAYDIRGNTKSVTDPAGKTFFYDYDAYGRLIKATDRLNGITTYAYDVRGNLLAVQDPKGHTLRYTYDRANRRTAEIRPLGQTTTYGYDAAGNLTRITYPSGIRHELDYDDAGQLVTHRSYAAGQASPEHTVSYTYDAVGRLIGWADTAASAGTATTAGVTSSLITWDDNGQKTGETVNYGAFSLGYQYAWQANGYLKRLTYPDNYTVTYTWAEHDELQGIDLPGEGPIAVTDWQWLAPTRTLYPGGTLAERQVDGLFKLKQLKVRDPGQSTVLSVDNQYGPRQELAQQTRDGQGGNRSTSYGYDDELRLTRASGFNGPLGTETYTLDPADNRITHSLASGTWSYDANDRLIQKGGTTYTWDDDGNLIQKAENGRTWKYRYDSLRRLVRVDDGSGQVLARYAYDPFDRRIWKETYDASGTPARQYVLYSAQGRLAEADANGNVTRSYGWRPDGGWETDPLFVRDGSGPVGAGGSTIAYLHNDGQGSPLLATDKAGNLLWQADYSAFGKALVRNDSLHLALRRPGQWEDPETGLYYNDRRYYDADIGRYITQDPLGLGGGTPNYYAYTGGNPTNFTDPTGEIIPILFGMAARCVGQCMAFGAAGAAAGAALEYLVCDTVDKKALLGSVAGMAKGCLMECANPLNWFGAGPAKAVKGEAKLIQAERKMAKAKQEASAEVKLMECNSFDGSTPVHVQGQDGEDLLKAIQDIRIGDQVLAWGEWKAKGEQLSYEAVTDRFSSEKRQTLVHLTLANGETLTATAHHPIKTSDGWRDAILIKKGGQLLLKGEGDGERWATVTEVRIEETTRPVFNLEVANAHTFFVGEEGVAVHNASCKLPPETRAELGKKPTDLDNAHAHHIVMKGDLSHWSDGNRNYVEWSRAILDRHGIELHGPLNVGWASNQDHSAAYAKAVFENLLLGHQKNGKDGVIAALNEMKAELRAGRKIR